MKLEGLVGGLVGVCAAVASRRPLACADTDVAVSLRESRHISLLFTKASRAILLPFAAAF